MLLMPRSQRCAFPAEPMLSIVPMAIATLQLYDPDHDFDLA
jgi:hypothetical protein